MIQGFNIKVCSYRVSGLCVSYYLLIVIRSDKSIGGTAGWSFSLGILIIGLGYNIIVHNSL